MNINLVVIQPNGYVHSLVFVDVARALRHGLRRIGIKAHITKNRLRADCTNWILGGHLALRPEQIAGHRCVIVNLEQMGHAGAALPDEYRHLLGSHPVLDYDAGNLEAYRSPGLPVGLFEFSHVSYLEKPTPALRDREIDLLFYGSVNDRRRDLFRRIEAAGVPVTCFDKPIYAEERDHYISNAKAVLNCSFYESHRFEQVRAFHCLSLGTPVVCERIPCQAIPKRFQESCFFFDPMDPAAFFGRVFRGEDFFDEADRRLVRWRESTPVGDTALLGFIRETEACLDRKVKGLAEPWRPTRINLGSGKDYRLGWLNVDVDASVQPDLVLDLSRPLQFPIRLRSELGGDVELQPDSVEEFFADNVLEHVPDLPRLMTQVLELLRDGGRFVVQVPCEGAPTAWQDPTHVRAFNQNSWLYYTDWFWYLGWLEHRFQVESLEWQDIHMKTCERQDAAFIRVILQKVETTPWERTIARTMRSNFGGIPEDL